MKLRKELGRRDHLQLAPQKTAGLGKGAMAPRALIWQWPRGKARNASQAQGQGPAMPPCGRGPPPSEDSRSQKRKRSDARRRVASQAPEPSPEIRSLSQVSVFHATGHFSTNRRKATTSNSSLRKIQKTSECRKEKEPNGTERRNTSKT